MPYTIPWDDTALIRSGIHESFVKFDEITGHDTRDIFDIFRKIQ